MLQSFKYDTEFLIAQKRLNEANLPKKSVLIGVERTHSALNGHTLVHGQPLVVQDQSI